MQTAVSTVVLLGAGVWIGAIVFQAAVVAPSIFRNLGSTAAARLLRDLFPRFFRLGLVCGLCMLPGLIVSYLQVPFSRTQLMLWFACLMLVLQTASLALVPLINRARDQGPSALRKFGLLHGASVMATLSILLLGIAVVVLAATPAEA
jgi:hypothetical protein